jgi:hypothetical protein
MGLGAYLKRILLEQGKEKLYWLDIIRSVIWMMAVGTR